MNFLSGLDEDLKTILVAQVRNIWTHTSTAIEGNSLTLSETAFVLEEGLTVRGKPLRDHQEIFGHARAIDLVYGLLSAKSIREEDLFSLHKAVLSESVMDIFKPVGKWKNQPNYTNIIGVDGKQHIREYPAPLCIPLLMSQWLQRLNDALSADTLIYADLHLDFVTIHPFFDGNGRLARLISNLPVLRSGLPPIIVPTEKKLEYLRIISDYQSTIPGLESLKDLDSLPKNEERQRFADLCRDFHEPTLSLLKEARKIQEKRIIS
ncbi:MAG: Fic family protein [Burkholderiales bacterium]|nr:Fic family protein [Burkholderiales bacterium]